MSSTESLILDVVSDVVCPWCFVGKRRIEGAAKLLGREIQIRWHPFELHPQIPKEGMPRQEFRIRKFGSLERSKALEAQLSEVGKLVGIDFRFDLITRMPNTRRAHVLMSLAVDKNLETQSRLAERLFSAYFLRGEDPGDKHTLFAVAQELGISSVTGPEIFDDPSLQENIFRQEEESLARGVQGVPAMFYGGRMIAAGAQPEQVLVNALRA